MRKLPEILLQVNHCDEEIPEGSFGFPSFLHLGDGYHYLWKVDISRTGPLQRIRIYDRYGKLLKQLSQHET